MRTIIADITITTQREDLSDRRRSLSPLEQRFLLREDGLVIRYHRYTPTTPWSTRPGSTTLGRASKAALAAPEAFGDYVRTRKGWIMEARR